MELDVLAEAKNLFQKNKPLIFIEVKNINIQYFKKWVQDNNYILIREYQRVNTIDFLWDHVIKKIMIQYNYLGFSKFHLLVNSNFHL